MLEERRKSSSNSVNEIQAEVSQTIPFPGDYKQDDESQKQKASR